MTDWRKSSKCSDSACVEVRRWTFGSVSVRSTTRPAEIATFTDEEWAAFVAAVKEGEFDE